MDLNLLICLFRLPVRKIIQSNTEVAIMPGINVMLNLALSTIRVSDLLSLLLLCHLLLHSRDLTSSLYQLKGLLLQ